MGDVDQLPSLGPGQILADVIASGVITVTRLSEVFCHAASSPINTTANAINAGTIPDLRPPPAGANSDFYFLPAEMPEQAVALILKVVGERIPACFGLDTIGQVQVVWPMARSGCGSRSLNIDLQNLLNPDPAEQVERFGWRFSPSDKVMQIANDYDKELFNGDGGTVETIDSDASELPGGRSVTAFKPPQEDQLAKKGRDGGHSNYTPDAGVSPLQLEHVLDSFQRDERPAVMCF
jgi:exodeoxyribonuclease V alpha subunit